MGDDEGGRWQSEGEYEGREGRERGACFLERGAFLSVDRQRGSRPGL